MAVLARCRYDLGTRVSSCLLTTVIHTNIITLPGSRSQTPPGRPCGTAQGHLETERHLYLTGTCTTPSMSIPMVSRVSSRRSPYTSCRRGLVRVSSPLNLSPQPFVSTQSIVRIPKYKWAIWSHTLQIRRRLARPINGPRMCFLGRVSESTASRRPLRLFPRSSSRSSAMRR